MKSVPVKGTTPEENIFKTLQTLLVDVKLYSSKLTGITTDDAPLTIGQKKGVVFLL